MTRPTLAASLALAIAVAVIPSAGAPAAQELPAYLRDRGTGVRTAIEWLRRLSPSWKVIAAIEGNQIDEVSLLTEVQWFINRHAAIKINNGLGLTPNATDFAPEVGFMLSI